MIIIAYIISIIIVALGGILVAQSAPDRPINQKYFIFSILSVLWLSLNSVSLITIDQQGTTISIIANKLISISSISALVGLFFFIKAGLSQPTNMIEKVILSTTLLITALLTPTNHIIYLDRETVNFGLLYPIVTVSQIVCLILIYRCFLGNSRRNKDNSITRQFLVVALSVSVFPAIIFGSFLPALNINLLTNVAPLFSIIFLMLVAYAELKEHKFDVRITIARWTGYILSIVFLSLLFAVTVTVSLNFLISDNNNSITESFAYGFMAVISSLLLPKLKKVFDKISQKVFYRDSYDSDNLLKEVSQVVLSSLDMEQISVSINRIICKYLKSIDSYILIIQGQKTYCFNSKTQLTDVKLKENLIKLCQNYNKNISNKQHITHVTNLSVSGMNIGYIALTEKKSLANYTTVDISNLDLIGADLSLAISNAIKYAEINNFNLKLQQRVNRATAELRDQNAKLLELDEAKDDFINMASHQLRTPTTTVIGYLSMVLDGDAGELTPMQKYMLGESFNSSQKLNYLIGDMLNVSRIRTGKFILDKKPINFVDLVEKEIKQLSLNIANKKIKLSVKKPLKPIIISLDEGKISQVIMNLIDNAIFYTPKQGSIAIKISTNNDQVTFLVTDTGIGVPKDDQAKIFSKFFRSDNAKRTRPDGTGLGLFIAGKVIDAHKGSVIFESQENHGSTFGFTLPL